MRGLSWVMRENLKKTSITKQVNLHSLRHSYATHLLEQGLNIVTIKELLGHSQITTTMDYSIDKNLLQGLRDNDDAAFKYLYQTSFIAVHSIATNSSRNKEDGEDLYNDGIIVLLDKIKKPDFVLNGKIQGLLYAICKKINSNSLRKKISKMLSAE